MPYSDLAREGRIRPHALTAQECQRHLAELLDLAELDLFDASIAQRPLDRRHNSAYEAARATAEAIMAAEGYRRAGGEGEVPSGGIRTGRRRDICASETCLNHSVLQ